MEDRFLARVDIAIVGLGAVGTALARAVEREGSRASLRLFSRRPGVAVELADALARELTTARGRATAVHDLAQSTRDAKLVILCVRDDELAERARDVAGVATHAKNAVLLHTSGFFGTDVLAPAARAGWDTGVLHPLRAFSGAPVDDLSGTSFAIEGEGRAPVRARQLVGALGGKPIELFEGPASRQRYHAAAALLSNGLVALYDSALELFGTAVRATEGERRDALWQLLVSGAIGSLHGKPIEEALTGPVSRGDASVVAGHLRTLADRPELAELYRLLSLRMVAIARRGDRANPADLDAIAELLSRPPPTA